MQSANPYCHPEPTKDLSENFYDHAAAWRTLTLVGLPVRPLSSLFRNFAVSRFPIHVPSSKFPVPSEVSHD